MERTLIRDLKDHIDKEISVSAWVDVARQQGKMAFFDFRDRTGKVQGVVFGKPEVLEIAKKLKNEWVVEVTGKVNSRPEKMVKKGVMNGDIELEITAITILSEAKELPFEREADLNLDTLLDYRPLTLRTTRAKDIFKLAASIVQSYRNALITREFVEFQAPALTGGDAEGGAEVFKLEYFKGREASLATSPQLYKEIMTGAFERAFTIAKIFRAEKSATSRHLSEITQMDFEMCFIKDHNDVMDMLENVIRDVCEAVTKEHGDIFERFGTTPPLVPEGPFPRMTLAEIHDLILKETGTDKRKASDMDPEDERFICEWAKKEKGSDFVFVTAFPTAKRAFYTYPDPENPKLSYSFDLLFRGLEINSGSQRFHNYEEMVATLESRGLDPELFQFYLQMHKYGIPPHGGCSTGLERITARMLDLPNVKEAVPFPRDINRIDGRLTTVEGSDGQE